MTSISKWRSRWDSNPRSPPWQGGMLTTTPLDQYLILNGADEGNWTPVSALARLCSTIELHLHEWRSRWDSNPRSPPWQGGMLTTTPLDHNFPKIRWRRRRDLNSRASFPTYTLSRGTSSATWVLLQEYFQNTYFLEQPALSVTPVYNNMNKNLLQAIFLKKIKKIGSSSINVGRFI